MIYEAVPSDEIPEVLPLQQALFDAMKRWKSSGFLQKVSCAVQALCDAPTIQHLGQLVEILDGNSAAFDDDLRAKVSVSIRKVLIWLSEAPSIFLANAALVSRYMSLSAASTDEENKQFHVLIDSVSAVVTARGKLADCSGSEVSKPLCDTLSKMLRTCDDRCASLRCRNPENQQALVKFKEGVKGGLLESRQLLQTSSASMVQQRVAELQQATVRPFKNTNGFPLLLDCKDMIGHSNCHLINEGQTQHGGERGIRWQSLA
eukprot:3828466-Amphidinium_carterae.2